MPACRLEPVRQVGKPAVEIGKPIKVAKAARVEKDLAEPTATRPAKVRPASNLLPTVESTDRALSAALLRPGDRADAGAHTALSPTATARWGSLIWRTSTISARRRSTGRTRLPMKGSRATWRDWGISATRHGRCLARGVLRPASGAPAPQHAGELVLAAVGHGDEARREYERAIQLDPGAAYALEQPLLICRSSPATPAQAVAECRTALSVDPPLAAARNTLASLGRRDARERVP